MNVQRQRVQVGPLGLQTRTLGEGPLVVGLHGFPDHGETWSGLMRILAPDFRFVALDLRGYGDSDQPVAGYDLSTLAGDVAGVIRTIAPGETVRVVGHDWGGAIAWALGYEYPELVDRLSILNAPHPHLFVKRVFTTSQLFRSWYMFFFQLPRLPEWMLRRSDGAALHRMLRGAASVPPEALSHGEDEGDRWDPFVKAMLRPGVLRCALAYYRTAFRQGPWKTRRYAGSIECPVQVLWGEEDPALGVDLLRGLDRYVSQLDVVRIPEAGHWVHWDAEERVAGLLKEWWER